MHQSASEVSRTADDDTETLDTYPDNCKQPGYAAVRYGYPVAELSRAFTSETQLDATLSAYMLQRSIDFSRGSVHRRQSANFHPIPQDPDLTTSSWIQTHSHLTANHKVLTSHGRVSWLGRLRGDSVSTRILPESYLHYGKCGNPQADERREPVKGAQASTRARAGDDR